MSEQGSATKKRKKNFSMDEIRVLMESYKEYKAALGGVVSLHGPRHNTNEIWDAIFIRFKESFPETDRTAWNLRHKVTKLKMETMQAMQKERRRVQDVDGSPAPKTLSNMSATNKLVVEALKEDFPVEDYGSDPEFVEYEMEFDDEEGASDEETNWEDEIMESAERNRGKRKRTIKSAGYHANKDDDEDDQDDVDEEVETQSPQQMFRQMMFPERRAKKKSRDNSLRPKETGQQEPTEPGGSGGDENGEKQPQKKMKSKLQTTAQDILDLRKAKLLIERDNLLLVQRKLRLEVKLAEKQLQDATGSSTSRSSRCSHCGGGCGNSNGAQVQAQSDGSVSFIIPDNMVTISAEVATAEESDGKSSTTTTQDEGQGDGSKNAAPS